MHRKILVLLLLFACSGAQAQSKSVRNLYHIIVDMGGTATNTQQRNEYAAAFMNYVFGRIKPSSKDIVIILTTFTTKNIWYGPTNRFKGLGMSKTEAAEFRQLLTDLDHVDRSGQSFAGQVGVDIKGALLQVSKNERRFSRITGKSEVFMMSPFLDVNTVMTGAKQVRQDRVIQENLKGLSKVVPSINPVLSDKRFTHFYWVNSDIAEHLGSIWKSAENGKYEIHTEVEARTFLARYLPPKEQKKK